MWKTIFLIDLEALRRGLRSCSKQTKKMEVAWVIFCAKLRNSPSIISRQELSVLNLSIIQPSTCGDRKGRNVSYGRLGNRTTSVECEDFRSFFFFYCFWEGSKDEDFLKRKISQIRVLNARKREKIFLTIAWMNPFLE